MILTRRGWLEHSDVRVGDETIGYNPATGNSEWTRITAVHHYDDAPLVRLGNSRWHATTTPEHRWLNLPRITDPAPGLPDSCPLCPWPDMYYSCRFTVSVRPYVFRDGHAAACSHVSGCWGWRLD